VDTVAGVRQFQIVQHDVHRFTVHLLGTPGLAEPIRTNIRDYLGSPDAEIAIEHFEEIERTRTGKFHALICEIPHEDK